MFFLTYRHFGFRRVIHTFHSFFFLFYFTMSSPDRFYGSHGKIRRSSPGADAGQGVGLFHGQGGRPRLPPISSAFPTSPHFPGLLF